MSTGHERVTPPTVKRPLPPGIDRLPSGQLRVRVYGPDQRRRTVGTYSSEKAAKDALATAKTDLLRGAYVDRKRAQITLDAWMVEWMPQRAVRPLTLHSDQQRYDLHIKPHLGALPLAKITPYQVRRWLTQLERDGRTVATRKKAHTLLSTALGIHGAVGDQRLTVNPCQIIRAPLPERRRWRLLTQTEFERIYGELTGMWRPIALLAAHGGLRWSEIAGLQRADYNPLARTLHVQRGLTYLPKHGLVEGATKNQRTRTVPLSQRLVDELNTHVTGSGYLFTRNGQPLAPYHQVNVWRKATRAAKVPCRFHDLRHSCASWLLQSGATLAEVRDMLGHSSVTVTEIYLHADQTTLADRITQAFG